MPLFRPYEHRRSPAASTDASDPTLPGPDSSASDSSGLSSTLAGSSLAGSTLAESSTLTGSSDGSSTVTEEVAVTQVASGSQPAPITNSSPRGSATKTASQTRLQPKGAQKKSQPTRTRAEAERARREQLHPTVTPKEAKARARETKYQSRQEALARQEATPERELLRDYIDSRWTWAEFILPVFVLLWALSMASAQFAALSTLTFQYALATVMMLALLGMFINVWWVYRGFKREAYARIKNPRFQGLFSYCMNRMIWLRRFRRPPARIARGADY